MQIKEFSELTGVSVRTLHYYDEIGLLKPASVAESSGYRFYNHASLLRLQEILFYRELDFSLKTIGKILAFAGYDKTAALSEQKVLLTLKKERLERLIAAIDGALEGENVMNAFDNSEYTKYQEEAKAKWGGTEVYAEYEDRSKGHTKESHDVLVAGMEAVMGEFACCMKSGVAPDSADAQALVKKLQEYISGSFYTCTNQILAGLGQMYVGDERFKNNIDKHGDGNAEFIGKAIEIYCK